MIDKQKPPARTKTAATVTGIPARKLTEWTLVCIVEMYNKPVEELRRIVGSDYRVPKSEYVTALRELLRRASK